MRDQSRAKSRATTGTNFDRNIDVARNKSKERSYAVETSNLVCDPGHDLVRHRERDQTSGLAHARSSKECLRWKKT